MEVKYLIITLLFIIITFTSGIRLTDGRNIEAELTEEIILNDDIKNYINLLNETILLDNFYCSKYVRNVEGIVETDFYYDSQREEIIFIPKSTGDAYALLKLEIYDRYSINRYDSFNIQGKEWLGVSEVNYDGNGLYKLPNLTQRDREVIKLVCEDIYESLSKRQEKFEYEIYVGDFARGYNDGNEYIQMSLALIGEKKFYIWSEVTKQNEEYDVWMFSSPFLPLEAPEPLHQDEEANKKAIDNIVSMGERVTKLVK